jgi:hypothetical protein
VGCECCAVCGACASDSESNARQRTDLRLAEGGRHERATRGCSAFVAPPYKNAPCLKLEETIRGWTASGAVDCCGALEAIPILRVRSLI